MRYSGFKLAEIWNLLKLDYDNGSELGKTENS